MNLMPKMKTTMKMEPVVRRDMPSFRLDSNRRCRRDTRVWIRRMRKKKRMKKNFLTKTRSYLKKISDTDLLPSVRSGMPMSHCCSIRRFR